MKLSLNWLNDYIDLSDISTEDLVDRLTMSTCEVDNIETPLSFLESVVTAKVSKIEKHANADKLSICQVDSGQKELLQIVCGAKNVKEGMSVALAKVGAKIPLDTGENLEIKPAKIRGIESSGMLCAAPELHLQDFWDFEDGLMDLSACGFTNNNTKTGITLTELLPLNDTILDIDNKSITHRPDLWCHFGFAREIAAIYSKKIIWDPLDNHSKKNISLFNNIQLDKTLPIKKIKIHDNSALVYNGVHLSGVEICPSPLWLKIRLIAVGQRPVNNVVDSSNYAMLESGQPNHAFDSKALKQDTISVFKNGTGIDVKEIETLDNQKHAVPQNTAIITDGEKKDARVLALAGVMGCAGSEVTNATTDLFLESATFPRELIRRTVNQTQIRTDSSQRFEKGQDPSKSMPLLYRLMALISQTLPDQKLTHSEISSLVTKENKKLQIKISLAFIQKRIGFLITQKQIQNVLERLHFKFEIKGEDYLITVPSFRSQYDITIPEDIIEELGRILGYDNIEPIAPEIQLKAVKPNLERKLQNQMKTTIANLGANETYNYSFCNQEENVFFVSAKFVSVELANPVFGDRPFLRMSLFPGLLHQAKINQDRFSQVDLFECGRVYFKTSGMKSKGDRFNPADLALEEKHINLVHLVPNSDQKIKEKDQMDLYYNSYQNGRLLLGNLMHPVVGKIKFTDTDENEYPFLHPGCSSKLFSGKTEIGFTGLLHPELQTRFALKRQALISHLNFDEIFKLYESNRNKMSYSPPSVFQNSSFELSVLLNKNQGSHIPVAIIESLNLKEIDNIIYLTSYQGESLPDGKKSVSYRMHCSDAKSTIENERLQKIMDRCIQELQKNNIPLR